ncbi:SGNH/GDSL hydrolase family protein [Herbiconiux ginsengi]|uniref:GDSL-like Lipase/Acylhydrolase family protein n=1 Tax=Herbiconiux ginsengi TaxID=381665 RepID=A0A1H3MCV4_9MICO|nr:SGNH/GDSL hydrolase family protein [Herbiconiux ginsengi]SDY74413.1 GDSL-like Lipase/Acylhydrolase family protein [Herbiconiux ginsengi]
MTRPPRQPSAERRSRRLLAAAAVCAVVTVAAASVSVWALTSETGHAASVSADQQPAAGSGAGGAGGAGSGSTESGADGPGLLLERHAGAPRTAAALSFGHTTDRAVPSPGAPMDASMRLPFELGVPAEAFRVHIRNWQFNSEETFPTPVTITGVYLGEQAMSGESGQSGAFASTPVGVAGTANLSTDGFVSDWIEPGRFTLDAHTSYLLSLGWTAPAGAVLATNPGLSWLATDAGSSRANADGVQGAQSYLSYFDVWIEYEYSGDAPLLVSIGHSLNAPGNYRTDLFPTRGEQTAWPQQWALSNDAAAVSFASPGAETTVFGPGAAKWTEFGELDPDIVTIWTASNDIAHGRPLADIERDWGAVVTQVQALWPDATVYALTEPPRDLSGAAERTRLDWNSWLSLGPYGVDRVLDADYTLRDPQQPSVLRPDVNADGIHFTARGHSLIAGLIPAPRLAAAG